MWALAVSAGVGWALLNASVIVVASFAPSFLMSRGASVGEAGGITGARALDQHHLGAARRLRGGPASKPRLLIVVGCLATALTNRMRACAPWPALWLVVSGILLGLPPSIMMALLPRAVPAEHLATAFGVFYALFYLGMAVSQTIAGAAARRHRRSGHAPTLRLGADGRHHAAVARLLAHGGAHDGQSVD